ncbi:uncharacterized protein HD556DRAFT_1353841 [Suillus plorans]|uniref:Uncharacterized protein n=1 Tax=Suillus plorans TaxID=116603 RepID=A0A9P7J052_9AGAM|nr:uncharacterized protein HD556DRAFT_1353841 [Suillus plorans]KAG1798194.1 hypothetical protein HD556DRAFT_1353841 [Suillus plorans]
MTVLYLGARYLGILATVMYMLGTVPTIFLSDTGFGMSIVWYWTVTVIVAMLQVIIITRLHAMYQRSRKILIFLIVIFLAVNILNGVVTALMTMHISEAEPTLSSTYQCMLVSESVVLNDLSLLYAISLTLFIVFEVVALCLAVWIALKHFRELRQYLAGGIIGDCFTVLIKSHAVHFTSMVVISCIMFATSLTVTDSPYTQIILGFVQILQAMQIVVLGPRLILGIREYHAKLVAHADAVTVMTSIAFQERVHILTGSGV